MSTQNRGRATKLLIEGVSPEEYASYWGCDSSYDHLPNHKGDGALFYNFSSERQDRTPEWLLKFVGAIDRTLQGQKHMLELKMSPVREHRQNVKNLGKLRDYVTGLLPRPGHPYFGDCDEFTQAYIEAALWSTNDESTPSGGVPLDDNYSPNDIAPQTLLEIIEDCEAFQRDNAADLSLAYEQYKRSEWSPQAQAGHDFWLTRNGHGAGFWDRGLEDDLGDRLSDASRKLGEVNLYVGDDGKIYS